MLILNILEGMLADNIEPLQPIDLHFCQSLGGSSNRQLKSNTNGNKKERMEGKFVSKNVLNLSNRVLTESEIKILGKGLNFAPTPEKLDRYQIKKDLERVGREISLKYIIKLNQHQHSLKTSFQSSVKLDSSYSRCSTSVISKRN